MKEDHAMQCTPRLSCDDVGIVNTHSLCYNPTSASYTTKTLASNTAQTVCKVCEVLSKFYGDKIGSVHRLTAPVVWHASFYNIQLPSHSPLAMLPIVPASFGDIVTAVDIVHSIYKALSDSMGASYDYQCLIMELRSFEQALKIVDLAIAVAPPTGRDAFDIATETTTSLELLKKFDDRIKSYQKALGGRKGASWRKIGWSLFKADEVASFRQKISQHKQNITLFLNGLMM